jgi:hypothetical protein
LVGQLVSESAFKYTMISYDSYPAKVSMQHDKGYNFCYIR